MNRVLREKFNECIEQEDLVSAVELPALKLTGAVSKLDDTAVFYHYRQGWFIFIDMNNQKTLHKNGYIVGTNVDDNPDLDTVTCMSTDVFNGLYDKAEG